MFDFYSSPRCSVSSDEKLTVAVYRLTGPLFFGSVQSFRELFSNAAVKSEPEQEVNTVASLHQQSLSHVLVTATI